MSSALDLLQRLVSVPAPPGQEDALAAVIAEELAGLDLDYQVDAKGNVLVKLGKGDPKVVVTAHLDELALLVTGIEDDGYCRVTNLGGFSPAKWGEGTVEILSKEPISGVLSFGSVHTEDDRANLVQARERPLRWTQVRIFTGRPREELEQIVRVGSRAVISKSRRKLSKIGEFVAGYFLDDRADLAAWLLVLGRVKSRSWNEAIWFVATVSEEVGGHGAQYMLMNARPEICIALELGPIVPDSPAKLNASPTVWVSDSYAAADHRDLEIIAGLGHDVQFQALSRGGSDASCAAANGLCARPVTLGIPMENTHGYEVIHRDAIDRLADLTEAYLDSVMSSS